jgi:hypothetical protein
LRPVSTGLRFRSESQRGLRAPGTNGRRAYGQSLRPAVRRQTTGERGRIPREAKASAPEPNLPALDDAQTQVKGAPAPVSPPNSPALIAGASTPTVHPRPSLSTVARASTAGRQRLRANLFLDMVFVTSRSWVCPPLRRRLAYLLPGLAAAAECLLHPSSRRVPHHRPFCRGLPRCPIRRF